jgi:membrane protein YqaA with SNARE-associated domain
LTTLKAIYSQYKDFFVHLLAVLDIWGVLVIATVDAVIPVIPLDVVVATYVYKDPGRFWLYALMGAVGSAAGSLVIYWIGRKGGEPLLLKKITHERLEELRDRYESWGFVFVAFNAILPPPAPMKLIILAAGAFEMHVRVLFGALFVGRMIRFSILSFLVIKYGPTVVNRFGTALKEHPIITIAVMIGVPLLIFLAFRARKRLSPAKTNA